MNHRVQRQVRRKWRRKPSGASRRRRRRASFAPPTAASKTQNRRAPLPAATSSSARQVRRRRCRSELMGAHTHTRTRAPIGYALRSAFGHLMDSCAAQRVAARLPARAEFEYARAQSERTATKCTCASRLVRPLSDASTWRNLRARLWLVARTIGRTISRPTRRLKRSRNVSHRRTDAHARTHCDSNSPNCPTVTFTAQSRRSYALDWFARRASYTFDGTRRPPPGACSHARPLHRTRGRSYEWPLLSQLRRTRTNLSAECLSLNVGRCINGPSRAVCR